MNAERICSVDGCDQKHFGRGYCNMHHKRLWRYGQTEKMRAPRFCSVNGCGLPHFGRGYCNMHYTRLVRNGTVEFVGYQRIENPTYRTVHSRLRQDRGHACRNQCVDCDGQADEWSYDHTDLDELVEPGTGRPYSTDLDRYEPRCKSCHSRFDRKEVAHA